MEAQREYCLVLDKVLSSIRDDVLPSNTLMVVVPQGDLATLHYLRGLRMRSKWNDGIKKGAEFDEQVGAAVIDAINGAIDSCVFFSLK
ncbi:hypothetical protein PINS_up005615 [Pythium insidiosum]|nr:hypothetical protein PINS_up005615 [Pythium insidiosum]